ncbi:hypothetical protein [Ectothiorhodospira shaposhnikovii]|uniref:hypothetical protein n=1 Tax=Ectothiorhodospira shaposhnikovii TaxID=1054 RepID=UPI001EE8C3AE|nr:hypothetical protein [Ectothiorhodospira shaposhnikovii]MCG5511703.1 hypothetical protein [Ectothiorhodospira shaposhnikovii]
MDHTLNLGWTRGQARTLEKRYRQVLGINLLLLVLVGLWAILSPTTLARAAGLPLEETMHMFRAWGGMLLLAVMLYLPGWLSPLKTRWPNMVGILGRFGMGTLFLLMALFGGAALRGLLWFALFDLIFAAALAILYFRLAEAELMSRP